MKPTGIVFDLDGTLVDAFADIAAAINRPLAALGLPVKDVETIKNLVGEGAGRLIERASEGAPPEKLPWIREEMMAWYREHPADLATIYDDVLPMLDDFKARGISMAILSNKPHPMTLKTCEDLGISEYFTVIQGEDPQKAPRKPDPGALQALSKTNGLAHPIMVGDGVPDGRVAVNAGVPFVACLWGTRSREQLDEFNPVAVAESPAQLHRQLLELLGLNPEQ
ncbi:MAG: HAD family hydrolase [Candidatus Sumerlaeia bacterium]|nr:HAD family hydrolase [Candidatus Sumerlaeia bacterium]